MKYKISKLLVQVKETHVFCGTFSVGLQDRCRIPALDYMAAMDSSVMIDCTRLTAKGPTNKRLLNM